MNRAQYASVLADDDYKSALKFADDEPRKIYENDAKTIDEIQKGIIAISQNEEPFDDSKNYAKAIRFGDEALKTKLQGYVNNTKNNAVYNEACDVLEKATRFSQFDAAEELFRSISGYRDADALAIKCAEKRDAKKEEIYQDALSQASTENVTHSRKIHLLRDAIERFELIPGWKNADGLIDECYAQIEREKEAEKKRIADERRAEKRNNVFKVAIFLLVISIACLAVLSYVFYIKPWIDEKELQERLAAEAQNIAYE